MNYSDDNITHWVQNLPHSQKNDRSFVIDEKLINENDESDEVFANIFSTNLEDLLDLSVDYTVCEDTKEQIAEAMSLPEEQRERRLEAIDQHVRFMKGQDKLKKIMNEKNHRPFDDSNIGLCSVCLDDNFQIVHPCGSDMACEKCFEETSSPNCTESINK